MAMKANNSWRIDGLVGGDEVDAETGDFADFFEADDG
jgi:hypothetical protein